MTEQTLRTIDKVMGHEWAKSLVRDCPLPWIRKRYGTSTVSLYICKLCKYGNRADMYDGWSCKYGKDDKDNNE